MNAEPPRLQGVSNFRSLGGLAAHDGRRVRPHRLLRSERLNTLTQADWTTLDALGVTTIIDLRSERERREHPNDAPRGFREREITVSIDNDLRGDPTLMGVFHADPTPRGAGTLMAEIYRRFHKHFGPRLPGLFARLLAADGATLIHCTAGKDRTGFLYALLLTALDVPREAILADYLRSGQWPGAIQHRETLGQRMRRHGASADLDAIVDVLLGVRESWLDAAFAEIEREYGSVAAYLERAAGLDAARRAQLRDRLLEG